MGIIVGNAGLVDSLVGTILRLVQVAQRGNIKITGVRQFANIAMQRPTGIMS